jgi:tRNA modification GTPase
MPFGLHPSDTIAALASPAGHAARGIIRISGPETRLILEPLFRPAADSPAEITHSAPWCYSGTLHAASLTVPLPADLYLWPTRRSYTGQPMAELHTISSPPMLEAILADLFARGVRPAHPGEFTLRAFLAGRIDLPQAEAVLGVIDAVDDRELQTALDQLAGGLSSQLMHLRGDLMDLSADLEAGLDFADEAIEFVAHAALVERLLRARRTVSDLLERAAGRTRPAARARVVLAGPPNAGKSTLFNALAGTAAALVSEIAGTTRDFLTADLSIDGVAVTLIDTAGTESPAGGIAAQAQQRRHEQVARADLVIWCLPADLPADGFFPANPTARPDLVLAVVTKCDLASRDAGDSTRLAVSAHSGAGLRKLTAAIAERLSAPAGGARQLVGMTAARSRDSLVKAHAALDRALAIARIESDQELLAIEVREALDELGKIAGAVYTDDILDRIFSRFCIGK